MAFAKIFHVAQVLEVFSLTSWILFGFGEDLGGNARRRETRRSDAASFGGGP